LYVALAQRKEDRKAQLASQYMQRMATMRMQNAGAMPVFAQPNAGYYVQGGIPSQRGQYVPNAIQPQMRANMQRWNGGNLGNSGYGSMQGYVVQQPGQFAAHRGAPRQQAGVRPQHYQAGTRQPQQHYQVAGNRPAQVTGGQPAIRQQPIAQQGKPMQQQGQVYYQQPAQQGKPVLQEDLASKLSSATPQEQKQILGEQLYPLISKLCKVEPTDGQDGQMSKDQAGKITGMMLEMDNSELLVLLDNSDLLQSRVQEANVVLQQSSSKPTV